MTLIDKTYVSALVRQLSMETVACMAEILACLPCIALQFNSIPNQADVHRLFCYCNSVRLSVCLSVRPSVLCDIVNTTNTIATIVENVNRLTRRVDLETRTNPYS